MYQNEKYSVFVVLLYNIFYIGKDTRLEHYEKKLCKKKVVMWLNVWYVDEREQTLWNVL